MARSNALLFGLITIDQYGPFARPMISYIVATVIHQTEADMNYPTHALDLHPATNPWLARVRKTKVTRERCLAATAIAAAIPGPEPTADELSDLGLSVNRFRSGLAARVEYALFAVTLAAVGYLYLGVALVEVLTGNGSMREPNGFDR